MTFENSPLEIPEERNDEVFFTRHSMAQYLTYLQKKLSDDPTGPIDYESQIPNDLSEKGIELAKEKALDFFANFDPSKDVLFFASSNEARAIETADVYRRIAKEKGFEILIPEHTRSSYADEVGDGEIRVLQNLSLNIKNMIVFSVFNPDSQQNPKFLEKVDPETRAKYEQARAIINAHDYGNLVDNFYNYSEEVKKIFPEIKTAEDMFSIQFRNLTRLAKFGLEKAKESGLDKNVKIISFGHENYMINALQEYFGERALKNCETIQIDVSEEGVSLTKGNRTEIRKQN